VWDVNNYPEEFEKLDEKSRLNAINLANDELVKGECEAKAIKIGLEYALEKTDSEDVRHYKNPNVKIAIKLHISND